MGDVFLQHLAKICRKNNLFDYNFQVSDGSVKGDNFMGLMQRVDVCGKTKDGEDAELSLIVKRAPSNEMLRHLHGITYIYDREIYTYEKILPCFADLQKSYNVPVPFESYPKYYSSCKKEPNEFLIMKNMKSLGYKNLHKWETLDFNHAALVLMEIGKIHALSFILKRDKPEVFYKFCNNAQDVEFKREFRITSPDVVDMFSYPALKLLDPIYDQVAFAKFSNFRKNMVEIIKQSVANAFNLKHAVIAHSDYWVMNLLFKYQNDGVPSDVCMLDWQFLRVASPAFDISQVFFVCCDKKLRDNHYTELLQEYYKSFSSFLKFFGEDSNKVFPYNVLLEHLKKYSLQSLSMAIRTLYISSIDSTNIPDLSNMKTIKEAIASFTNIERNEEVYCERMRDVILDYIKFGYDM